jgi:hypothetical protein
MKLEVVGRFSTTVSVAGETRRFAAAEGQIFDLDEQTSLALLRDVGSCLREVVPAPEVFAAIREETPEPVTAAVMAEVPEDVAVPAHTRQIVRKPVHPKPTARKKTK